VLSFDYQANVSGKVAAVGGRMLEGAAKVVLRQLFEALGREALRTTGGGNDGGSDHGGNLNIRGAGPAIPSARSWWQRLVARLSGSS
jgi:hypothetical protein